MASNRRRRFLDDPEPSVDRPRMPAYSRTAMLALIVFCVALLSLVLGLGFLAMADVFSTNSANRGASYAVSTVLAGGSSGSTDLESTVEAYGTALALLPDFQRPYSWKIGKFIRSSTGSDCNGLTQNEVNSMFSSSSTLRGSAWDVADSFDSGTLTDTRGSQLACYGIAIPSTVTDLPDRFLIIDYPPIDDVFGKCGNPQITFTESGVTYNVFCTAVRLDSRLLNGARIVLAYHY